MKVGTDAVLLGAWTCVDGSSCILDIGTGCGLIALMIAQRTEKLDARIDAIDREKNAAAQAQQNVSSSPWAHRVSVSHQSLQELSDQPLSKYDLCVCNPPFFESGNPSQNERKGMARHSAYLSRDDLFVGSKRLLNSSGKLNMVLPYDQLNRTIEIAQKYDFFVGRQTSVRPSAEKPFHRVLLELTLVSKTTIYDDLTIERVRHEFTSEYKRLTQKFHLRFASG